MAKKMSFSEFTDTLGYREKFIYIPALNSGINKVKFVTPKGYDFESEKEAIKYAYKVYLNK